MKFKYFAFSSILGIFSATLLLGTIKTQAKLTYLESPVETAVDEALDWLLTQQITETGGYGSGSSTVETTLSIGSSNLAASSWKFDPNGRSLMDYWLVNGDNYANLTAGESGKLAMGLVAADGCWPYAAFKPRDFYSPTSGIYDVDSINQAFAILGEAALSNTIPGAAITHLRGKMQSDGGWEFSDGFGSDTNTTAVAIQALLASGETSVTTEVISGLNYLKSAQNTDGGFTYDPISIYGTDSDTNSTAYAVQAILAAGEDPTVGRWVINSTNPISYLLGMQLSDGSFEWQPDAQFGRLSATQQAITALNGKFFPLQKDDLALCPIRYLPVIVQ
ncbi:MAG: prenyltransferase/squalene oxidase repeat-containing protein [Anaerolineales bacterium]